MTWLYLTGYALTGILWSTLAYRHEFATHIKCGTIANAVFWPANIIIELLYLAGVLEMDGD